MSDPHFEDVSKIYKDRFIQTGINRRKNVWNSLCKYYFNKLVPRSSKILDLACGYGEFINNIDADHKFAIDLNPDSRNFLNSDVSFYNIPVSKLKSVGVENMDIVFTSNFLEHLKSKEDCIDVFNSVNEILRPGGVFIILGPNIRYAYKEYWDYFDHYLPLSHLSAAEGLRLCGFKIKTVIPRFLPYTMNNRTPTSDYLIFCYLNIPFAWRFFGKQFLIVAEK